jgi:uridine phosphorylase
VFGRRWERYLSRRYPGSPALRNSGIYRANDEVGVSIVGGPGAPYAAIVVEELAALGVRRFLIAGIAGSLQPKLRAGSLVICNRALRDEGTSHHYAGPSVFAYPSSKLTRVLRSTLERHGTSFTVGPTWTTDAPYRETIPEVRRYRKQGILTVEMEASAVFSVARCRGCEAAAMFVISDHLDERGWEPRFHDSRPGLRHALNLAVEALAA